MNTKTADILVIGGGITGLTTAWHLHKAGRDVHLLEARDHVGGAIRTEERDGFLLEKGPFNVIVRDPAFEALLDDFADAVTVVTASDQAKNRYIYRHGRLMPVPTGLLQLLSTPLLSAGAKARLIRGLLISQRGKEPNTTLDEFASRRFGPEVADTLVSAAIAGILAGDIRTLNAYACFPVLEDFDRKSFSPLGRTLRRVPQMISKRRSPAKGRRWKGLVSLDRGLGALVDAMAHRLGDRVVTNAPINGITHENGRYRVVAGDEVWDTPRLVLSSAAQRAATLLEPLRPDAARTLREIQSASLVVVNLAFRAADVGHPLDGFGFLVPRNEPAFPLMGVLFADSAFPHHAPADQHLLRAFIGGTRTPDAPRWTDERLLAAALQGVRETLLVTGEPTLVDICRYEAAIPQYDLQHRQRIAQLHRCLANLPNLYLAANYLEGVSINDCIRVGRDVAQQIMAEHPASEIADVA